MGYIPPSLPDRTLTLQIVMWLAAIPVLAVAVVALCYVVAFS